MKKQIIYNNSSLSDIDALQCVISVMRLGRISESRGKDQYCWVTRFKSVIVSASLTRRGSDVFRVEDI